MHGEPVEKMRTWTSLGSKQRRIEAYFNEKTNWWNFV
jgi:hypothetical protein